MEKGGKKVERINVGFTKKIFEAIGKEAKLRGKTNPEWIRCVIIEKLRKVGALD